MEREPHTRLAGECLQPLGHLSGKMPDIMRRFSIVAVIAVSVLAVAGQFAAPRIASDRIEKRLTSDGGSARAEVHAFPWPRLLFTDGDSVKVRARGITLPLVSPTEPVLRDLDGFDRVDLEVTDATAGPVRLETAALKRDEGPYRAIIRGTVTPSDLARFVTGFALPFGDQPVPLDLRAVLRSDRGRPRAVTAHGTVAGLPAGPLVEALAQALAGRF